MNEDEKGVLQHFDKIFVTDTIRHMKLDMPLLKFVFEELEEILREPSHQYAKLRKHKMEISSKLYKMLNIEQEKLFEQYSQITNQMAATEDFQLFCFGYIMANELNKEGKFAKE